MGDMRDNWDEQQEQMWQQQFEQHQEEEFAMKTEIKYQCPYCGKVSSELVLCCGELHGEQIKE